MTKTRKAAIFIGIAYGALIFYLSVLTPFIPTVEINQVDKFYHLLAYGFLMWWWAQVFTGKQQIIALIAVIGFGIFIEFVQPLNNRFFEVADILANTLGALLGLLITKLGLKLSFAPPDKR